jgi:hypothetical protein
MGEIDTCIRLLVGKREGKRPLAGYRDRCKDNIKMHGKE